MKPGHGSGPDSSLKTVAHDQVVTLAQFGDERPETAEVVRVVRIAHDHIPAASGGDPGLQGAAVAAPFDMYHTRPVIDGDRRRAVRATVIGDDDLSRDGHF